MIEISVATLVGLVLVVGPLLWRVARDRTEARALSTRAYVQSLVDRKLGGESFVSVQVTPRGFWRTGQVVVAVPSGWEWLLEEVWPVLMARTPRGYEAGRAPRRGRARPAAAAPARRLTPACWPGSPSRNIPARGIHHARRDGRGLSESGQGAE